MDLNIYLGVLKPLRATTPKEQGLLAKPLWT